MRKHLGVGWGYWSTMTQNGTRMHKLRPLKPKFLWGRTPRPPCKKMYCLGVYKHPCPHASSMLYAFQDETHFDPRYIYIVSITTLAESKFIKNCGVRSPVKSPQCHLFPPKWPKIYKKWPKICQKWPKILRPKIGFPAGRPAYRITDISEKPIYRLVCKYQISILVKSSRLKYRISDIGKNDKILDIW